MLYEEEVEQKLSAPPRSIMLKGGRGQYYFYRFPGVTAVAIIVEVLGAKKQGIAAVCGYTWGQVESKLMERGYM